MRFTHIQDFRRGIGFDKFVQHLATVMLRILHLAVELAVGESAGTAFAELYIRFRMQFPLAPQTERILRALAHHLAAFQDDRPKTHLRQDQAGKEATWTGADHHWTRSQSGRRLRDEMVIGVRRRRNVAVAVQTLLDSRLVFDIDV